MILPSTSAAVVGNGSGTGRCTRFARKALRPIRVGLRLFRDREGNFQLGVFGDKGLRADQPACMSREHDVAARSEVRLRHVDGRREQRLIFVAVVHDRAVSEALWRRPDDGTCLEISRQRPFDCGGQT